MRLSKAFLFIPASLLLLAISAACGGGEETTAPTATTAAGGTVVPTTTTTPVATTTVISTQVPVTGTIIDRALLIAPVEEENVRYGGTYSYSTSRMAGNTDTKFNNSTTLSREWRFVYEKLVGWMPNEKDSLSHFEPFIAEKWSASADLKTYTFTIRNGIKWHNVAPVNGRAVVANDAVVSLSRLRESDATAQPNWEQVESITAPDARTVVIKLKEANAWAINDLFGALEAVVPPELIEAAKVNPGGAIRDQMVGTGPFILKNYRFRIGAEMVRNPDYWRKDSKGQTLPYLDNVSMKFIEDAATVAGAFRTNQIHHAENPTLAIEVLIEIGKQKPDTRLIHPGVLIGSGHSFNAKNAPWNDVNVRRAFNMSLDKERYMEITGKAGVPWVWHGVLPSNYIKDGLLTINDMGPNYKFNPTEAKKLLTAAGFADGKMKVGTPMVATAPGTTSIVIQELWKQQGIEVGVLPMPATEFGLFYYARSHKDLMPTFKNSGDSGLYWYARNKFTPSSIENSAFIDDPEINKLVTELKTVTDPVRTNQIAKLLWDFDLAQSYYIWMPQQPAYFAAQPNVRNLRFKSQHQFIGLPIMPWLTDAPRTSP